MIEDDTKVRNMEMAISLVLRIGVTVSVGIIAIGLGVTFAHHHTYASMTGPGSYHHLTSPSTRFPHTFAQLAGALRDGSGGGIVVLGVLVLILTPVLRVAVSVLSFVSERDSAMTAITLFVLAALVGSFFLGELL